MHRESGQKKYIIARKNSQTLLWWIGQLLYPPRCVLCDRVVDIRDGGCCRECRERLPRIRGPVCMKCGKPAAPEQEYCEDCSRYLHYFDCGTAAFTYTGKLRQSVYRMKFQNRRDYISFYAEAMAEALRPHLTRWAVQLILPVPMHPQKRRIRGYNQAELLARELGRLLGIPADDSVLRCVKKTDAQKKLDRKDRMKNLKGSFSIEHLPAKLHRVLLVDDVYTTGSTVDEISRVLKYAGVKNVFFVVICIGKGKKTVCTPQKICYNKKA
ncbi:ComF family protein [Parablautia sp. Marseille-Q6255]|uniref:ComF family protein n=1 Tax=Parablautia sp. Marseille-Q6255 TaxID=3039593 RepID=UPI0024BC9758|nr:ComF family protein [Parablautia sp. Marseille-Q6255]